MNRRFYPLSAVLALAALACGCAGWSPSATVKAFYSAVEKGKPDEAVELFSEQTVALVGKDKLKMGVQKAIKDTLDKGGIQHLEITDEREAGNVATVTVLVKYGNGTQKVDKVQLVKEKGGWRLQPEK